MANKNITVSDGKQTSLRRPAPTGHPRLVDSFITGAPLKSRTELIKPTHIIVKKQRSEQPAAKSITQTPQSAQTIMRHVVKKPTGLSKSAFKTQSGSDGIQHVTMHNSPVSLHKASSQTVDQGRLERATQVAQAAAIRRFTPISKSSYVAPTAAPVPPNYNPLPNRSVANTQPKPSASTQDETPPKSIFEKAIADSTSHKEKYTGPVSKKLRRRQHFGFAALFAAVLVMAAFVAYLNVPNLTMTVASARAGFHASVPGYLPSGFSTKHTSYTGGTVSTAYQSNTDSRSFTITQKESSWDSSALVSSFLASSDQNYQPYQNDGRTVYIYGNGNATWVDGGVWYTVTSGGSLPTRQLLDIASSL